MRLSSLSLLLLLICSSFTALAGLHGKVSDDAGKPISGVRIVIEKQGASTIRLNTGSKGTYSSVAVTAGTYIATFSADGYESQRIVSIVVPKGAASILLNIQLNKSTNKGRTIITRRYVQQSAPVPATRDMKSMRTKGRGTPVGHGVYYPSYSGEPHSAPSIDAKTPDGRPTKTAETIEKMPVASYTDAAALSTKAYLKKDASGISLGGARGTGTTYVVDGVVASGTTPVASVVPIQAAAQAGTLTSGEINDFSKWNLWEDISMEDLKTHRSTWHFTPEARYTVLVKSRNGMPLCNARVKLSNGGTVWEAITDNTGKAELWLGMWDATAAGKLRLSAVVDYGTQHYNIPSLKAFSEGVNILPTNINCLNPAKVDIAFLVDATGSMQDEIDYLKAELRDILKKVKDSMPGVQVQTGAVFYRDLSDEYITRASDLTTDFSKTEAFIADNNAGGGGDGPEAVDEAMEAGLTSMSWRADATTRLAFLVLDAPPHDDAATVKRMQQLTEKYAAQGVRLIPVVCSGADKSTEYLMRSIALATNGTYLFLTDHSGIGGDHAAPTTDKYDVEYLNGLIYRVIYNCSYMPDCHTKLPNTTDTSTVMEPVADSAKLTWRYYPNPTSGILNIEHSETNGYLLITDITGKAIIRIQANASGKTTVDMTQYPAGVYAIRYNWEGDKWVSGKFTVVH